VRQTVIGVKINGDRRHQRRDGKKQEAYESLQAARQYPAPPNALDSENE